MMAESISSVMQFTMSWNIHFANGTAAACQQYRHMESSLSAKSRQNCHIMNLTIVWLQCIAANTTRTSLVSNDTVTTQRHRYGEGKTRLHKILQLFAVVLGLVISAHAEHTIFIIFTCPASRSTRFEARACCPLISSACNHQTTPYHYAGESQERESFRS